MHGHGRHGSGTATSPHVKRRKLSTQNIMQTIQFNITGIRPLVMHNGQMIDPLNSFVRAIKDITKKKSKTDADHEAIAKLEWMAGLYLDSKDGAIIPSESIEACVLAGAKKSRIGKDVQAAVFMEETHAKVIYEGPRDPEKMYAEPRFALRRPVKVGMARVMRVRPMIPTGWQAAFTLSFDESILNRQAVVQAVQDAGMLCGLGDWRPKFGRFTTEAK